MHSQGAQTTLGGCGTSGNKRQRSRIQGGWAAPALGAARGRGQSSRGQSSRGHLAGRGSRPMGPHMDCSSSEHEPDHFIGQAVSDSGNKFEFQQPSEPIIVEAPITARKINESGRYVISGDKENANESVITLVNDFLSPAEADAVYRDLDQQIAWIQQVNTTHEGGKYKEPRMVCWYGEHSYAYSRVEMVANNQWPPVLSEMRRRVEERTHLTFNSVLANKYRNEKDGVAWHSDNERGLGRHPNIGSLSFGETRRFLMRKNPPKGCDPSDYSKSMTLEVPLETGSLLTMEGYTQDDWQHKVPTEYHSRSPRINLTFRNIYPI